MTGPIRDGENIPADELTAFSIEDVEDIHGYRDMFRRWAWTVAFVIICAGIAIGLVEIGKPR